MDGSGLNPDHEKLVAYIAAGRAVKEIALLREMWGLDSANES